MQIKSFFIFGLIFLALFLLGCVTSVPLCGDNICSDLETDPTSKYFCPSDCGEEIGVISKNQYWNQLIYCPDCENNSCVVPSKSNSTKSSIYDDSKCGSTNSCTSIRVSCLNDELWACSILKGGAAGCVGPCEIVLNSQTCTNQFGQVPDPNYSRQLPISFLTDPVDKTNITKAFSQCLAKHEMQHAIENCQCHNCKREIKARTIQSNCYAEIYNNILTGNYNNLSPTAKQDNLDGISRDIKRMQAEQNYHNCLCNNRTNNSNDESQKKLYKPATCAICLAQLKREFERINSETTNPNITPLPTNLTNTNNLYCTPYEKNGNINTPY